MQRADCRTADFDAYVSGAAIIAGTILTAARTRETFEMRCYEVQGNTWVIPDKRMKEDCEHHVLLAKLLTA